MKAIRASATVFVAALLIAGSAAWGAQDGEFQSKSDQPGHWDSPSTWEVFDSSMDEAGWRPATEADGLPGRDSKVVIQAGHTVVVSNDATVGKVSVKRGDGSVPGGTLRIMSDAVLNVHERLRVDRAKNGGAAARVVFAGQSGEPGTIRAFDKMGISGEVLVEGRAGGRIEVDNVRDTFSLGFKSKVSATGGPMTFVGHIKADGQVIADGPFEVAFTGLGIHKYSSGRWVAKHPKAVIRFATDRPVDLVSGSVLIEEGLLDVQNDVSFTGSVINKRGTIQVARGRELRARGVPVVADRISD